MLSKAWFFPLFISLLPLSVTQTASAVENQVSQLPVAETKALPSAGVDEKSEEKPEKKSEEPVFACLPVFSGTQLEANLEIYQSVYDKFIKSIREEADGPATLGMAEKLDALNQMMRTDMAERVSFTEVGVRKIPPIEAKEIVIQISKKKSKYLEGKLPQQLPGVQSIEILNLRDYKRITEWYLVSVEKFVKGALTLMEKEKSVSVDEKKIAEANSLMEFYHDFLLELQSGKLDGLLKATLRAIYFEKKSPSVVEFTDVLFNQWITRPDDFESLTVFDPELAKRSIIARKLSSVQSFFAKLKKGYKRGFTKELFEKSGPRLFRWSIGTGVQIFFMSAILVQSTAPEINLYRSEVTQIRTLIDTGSPRPEFVGKVEIEWSDRTLIEESRRFRETIGEAKERLKGKILQSGQVPAHISKIITTDDSKTIRDEITMVRIPELRKSVKSGNQQEIEIRQEMLIDAIGRYWMSSLTNDPIIFGPMRTEQDYQKEVDRINEWCGEFKGLALKESVDDELNRRMQSERNAILELFGIITNENR